MNDQPLEPGLFTGGGGALAPLQKTLSRFPAPQISVAFPVHGMLQSEAAVVADPPRKELPQSKWMISVKFLEKDLDGRLTAFLAVLDTGIDEAFRCTKAYTRLLSHAGGVGVSGTAESAGSTTFAAVLSEPTDWIYEDRWDVRVAADGLVWRLNIVGDDQTKYWG